jgi:hypothetical protein
VPSAPELVERVTKSGVLCTATVALATDAPEASITTPVIFPVVDTCDQAGGPKQRNASMEKM